MIIRRQTETRFVVAAAAPVVAEAIQLARRPQRPAGEAVDVVVYREQEKAKKLLQYVCGVCVLLQQRSLVLRPQAASLRPPTAMEIGHACLLVLRKGHKLHAAAGRPTAAICV